MTNGFDITERVVADQLAAMDCEYYDLLAISQQTQQVERNLESRRPETIVSRVSMLRAVNAQGCNIYVRPHGSVGLVLVDDLTPDALAEMDQAGLRGAVWRANRRLGAAHQAHQGLYNALRMLDRS